MRFLITIVAIIKLSNVDTISVGSALFYRRSVTSDCWSDADIRKLRARQVFEDLIPPLTTPDRIDGKYVRDLTNYFRQALKFTENKNTYNASILKDALADTIGGHLRAEILPTIRFAYYAGYISNKHARQAHDFYNNLKQSLNTLGLGWSRPTTNLHLDSLNVSKVLITPSVYDDPCAFLVLKRDNDNCIHLPKPRVDDSDQPAAIALPFKNGGLVSLFSPKSENVIIEYYTIASKCILQRSTNSCRHADFVNFNNEIWNWMKADVAAHLLDEKLYSAYGGILRVAAAVQGYGRGLKRRNLFDGHEYRPSRHDIFPRTPSYNLLAYQNWTPKMYIIFIVLVAFVLYIAQVAFTTFVTAGCGDNDEKKKKGQDPKVFAYTDVESNFPAMLPAPVSPTGHSDTNHSEHEPPPPSRTRTSQASMRTECVYDLNENQEKLMDVIMSAGVSSGESESTSESQADSEVDADGTLRASSPPQLTAQVMQLRSAQRSSRSPRSAHFSPPSAHDSLQSSQFSPVRGQQPSPASARRNTPNARHSPPSARRSPRNLHQSFRTTSSRGHATSQSSSTHRDAVNTTSYSDSGSSTSDGSWHDRKWPPRTRQSSRSQRTSEADLDISTSFSRQCS